MKKKTFHQSLTVHDVPNLAPSLEKAMDLSYAINTFQPGKCSEDSIPYAIPGYNRRTGSLRRFLTRSRRVVSMPVVSLRSNNLLRCVREDEKSEPFLHESQDLKIPGMKESRKRPVSTPQSLPKSSTRDCHDITRKSDTRQTFVPLIAHATTGLSDVSLPPKAQHEAQIIRRCELPSAHTSNSSCNLLCETVELYRYNTSSSIYSGENTSSDTIDLQLGSLDLANVTNQKSTASNESLPSIIDSSIEASGIANTAMGTLRKGKPLLVTLPQMPTPYDKLSTVFEALPFRSCSPSDKSAISNPKTRGVTLFPRTLNFQYRFHSIL